MRRRWVRGVLISFGVLIAAIFGFLWWQPWAYDFFPRPVPNPNPRVDPERDRLFAKGTRVTVVVAHPDDPEFYIGGLLTQLGRSGADLTLILMTDGDKGYYPFEDAEKNRRVRQAEQIEASNAYNGRVVFLGFPDGRLKASKEVVERLRDEIAKTRPDYVLGFDPLYPPRRSHGDHRVAGDATEQAIEGLTGIRWLGRFQTRAANAFFDISKDWPEKKRLLSVHRSQFFGDRLKFIEGLVEGLAKQDGAQIGVSHAEGLRFTKLSP